MTRSLAHASSLARCSSLALSFALLATLAAAPAGAAASRGPSTPEERAKLVALAAELEKTPRGPKAAESRQWLMAFLQEVPDILAKQCGSLFGPPAQRQTLPPEVLQQQLFSNAAYAVDKQVSSGSTEALTAGVIGALRVYEAFRADNSTPANVIVDDLLRLERAGELDTFVRAQGRACR
jgi:carboxypeptidase Q